MIGDIVNGTGRARASQRGDPIRQRTYHCSVISTAEDLLVSQSRHARTLPIPFSNMPIKAEDLSQAQEICQAGLPAQFTASFVQWLASRLEEKRKWARAFTKDERVKIRRSNHAREAEMQAELRAGIRLVCDFIGEAYELPSDFEAAADEAIERVSDCDIVFTDILMDDDADRGIDLIKRIRASGNDIPIVAISGTPDLLPKAIEAGADDKIAKPWQLETLRKTLSELVG